MIEKLNKDEDLRRNKVGFLLGLGFSIMSCLNDVGQIMRQPLLGETFQGKWDNGASIYWEAIPGGELQSKLLGLLYIIVNFTLLGMGLDGRR